MNVMDILLLGGTAFLGREIARQFLSSGHSVTCLARGSQPAPAGTTFIKADRDNADALRSVARTAWDAVIDLTSHPVHAVRAVGELSSRHWVYVSSSSVYTDFSAPEQSEAGTVHDPLAAGWMPDMSQFGPAKIACEDAYRAMDQPVTIIRPGLIGGWGDWTGRSGYYIWRCANPTGPDVLVPDKTQPTASLDVEDLAAWIVSCVTNSVTGTYNAAGQTTTLAEIYQHCQDLSGMEAAIRVVDDQTLLDEGVNPWMGPRSFPLWIPDPSSRFTATLDSTAAIDNGLQTRPIIETLTAALRYEEERSTPRQAGLTDEEERILRKALL